MINKGKGKLKWERDMPQDIEDKLQVIVFFLKSKYRFEEKLKVATMICFSRLISMCSFTLNRSIFTIKLILPLTLTYRTNLAITSSLPYI